MTRFARLDRLPPYVFATVNQIKMEARRAGEDIIDLGMGNPDIGTPQHIVDKLTEASQNPRNHRYSASMGITKLRMAISDWYKRRYDVDIDPESEAIVTIGVKEGMSHLILVTIRPGDVVFAPNPTYPIHPYSSIISGGDVRGIPAGPDQDFFENLIQATKQTWPRPKVLVLSYPHNPTTEVVDLDFFQRVVDFAKANDIMVIHDFAYADLTYDGYQAPSFLQAKGAKEVGVEFFSMSKSYSMAGLAGGVLRGQRRNHLCLETDKKLPGLRHFSAYPDRLHHRLEWPPGLRGRDSRHLSIPTRCPDIGPVPGRLGDRKPQGHHVRLGQNPRTVPQDGIRGVFHVFDPRSPGGRIAGPWLR